MMKFLSAAGLRAVAAGALTGAALMTGGGAFASTGQADPLADFLTKYVAWAETIEAEGQERGTPLTAEQLELAKAVGIQHPKKVRLVYADTVPFPVEDPEMRAVGESMGFIGPGVINNAQAFGYTIWIRNGFTMDRPALAHELVHVMQIERSASFGAYAREYVPQLLEHGHSNMPLEVEAYEANRKFAAPEPAAP